ncbi:hypothetical protein [Desulfonatronospira sp.]|uniref:hypothetical protein n=1 Tax=Desulfonatronospira sp. TaxID=1962951 RepID=UPI0025C3E291|nr:hypothetical protein [Desulfonatronospira sp.]
MNPTDELYSYLIGLSPLTVALSGGVDSITLAYFCHVRNIEFKCFTFYGPHITAWEISKVQHFVREYSIPHSFMYIDPLQNHRLLINSRERCYHCKLMLFSALGQQAAEDNTIVEGTNSSELKNYRPGMQALEELGIVSPFSVLGIDRISVEQIAQQIMVPQLPAFSRSCLMTRFEYGKHLDRDVLLSIKHAEDHLLHCGITGFRIRSLLSGETILQVDPSEYNNFIHCQKTFQHIMNINGLYPYSIQVLSFNRISGYFDYDINS